MKALVTGSAGFIGRHMSAELRTRGWTVYGRDLVDGQDCRDYFARVHDTLDLVVHAAASEPHRAAIDGDQMNMVRNLHLDSAMFDWAVRTGTRVLYLSSSAAYPVSLQAEWRSLTEDDLSNSGLPDAAYGWTKVTGEKMAAAVGSCIPVHVVRPFSGYGEDQDERFPFGAFVARAKRREDPFVVWGDGQQVRDWIHVDDVVKGALAVVEQDVHEPVNLCTGVGTSMLDLIEMICDRAGYDPHLKLMHDKPVGVPYRIGDATRLHQIYEPAITLTEGVARCQF